MYTALILFVFTACQGLSTEISNTISLGCSATLECPIYGDSYASLTWICGMAICFFNRTVIPEMEQKITVLVDEFYNRTYLIITDTNVVDDGPYSCTYMHGTTPFSYKFQLLNDTASSSNITSKEMTSSRHGFSIKEDCNYTRKSTIYSTASNGVDFTTFVVPTQSVDDKTWFPILWYVCACGIMTILVLFGRLLLGISKKCSRDNMTD